MRGPIASGLAALTISFAVSQQASPPSSSTRRNAGETVAGQEGPDLKSGCLPEKKHWSYTPDFARGVEVVLVRFLRFETPDGRTIAAKAFLYEIHPDRVPIAGKASGETAPVRNVIPARMACTGVEINVDEGYRPDFEVPVRYVKQRSKCQYEVNLGSTTCIVTTT